MGIWYSTGTVDVTNGSATVTGTGTDFVTNAPAGSNIQLPDGRNYEVQSVQSATSLTLARTYLGTSTTGSDAWEIVPTTGVALRLIEAINNLRNTVDSYINGALSGRFPAGSAAAPSLAFSTDPNTGFFRMAADKIGIATAGAARLVIDSIGNVGVGTTDPATALHVQKASAGTLPSAPFRAVAVFERNDNAGIYVVSGADDDCRVAFGDPDDLEAAGVIYNHQNQRMTFTVEGQSELVVTGDGIQIVDPAVPASATDTGMAGEIRWDADYIYVCTAPDTWKRAPLATW